MRKHVGSGEAVPQRRLAWAQLGPRAGNRGFFQGEISLSLPHHQWPFPTPSGCQLWRLGRLYSTEETS